MRIIGANQDSRRALNHRQAKGLSARGRSSIGARLEAFFTMSITACQESIPTRPVVATLLPIVAVGVHRLSGDRHRDAGAAAPCAPRPWPWHFRGRPCRRQPVWSVAFRDLWLCPGLAPRDRSLVTVSALIATGQVAQHLSRAMDNGLTQAQAGEVITHLAFYAGWPNAFSALPVAKEVFERRPR
jgi:alkylhydroperoxidase/carboxymuconolactone decarboxylase family protein YurZ